MNKIAVITGLGAAVLTGAWYAGMLGTNAATDTGAQAGAAADGGGRQGAAGRQGGGGFGGGGRGGGRGQLTVELAPVSREKVNQELAVVGNLVGDITVSVVPKTAGRLQEIGVKLGDRVTRGQRIAKIEDQEILEQVKQAEAAFQVASATIRQREADLALAKTNAERSRSLFQRQLLPQQTLDDAEAKYQSAQAALDLARAQNTQSQARLDELRITQQNTVITSPVNGFVARRAADPGAFVSNNAPIVDVVDISKVRLIVNVIEKDLRQINDGDLAMVEVDAFPGERFEGHIARVSPVLDPSTRTASVEIEILNPQYRLKPGMYARVGIVTDSHPNAVVVPTNSLVDVNGMRGVYLSVNNLAAFRPVKIGIEGPMQTEILDGVAEGDRVVTTGAAGLRNGDPIVLAAGARGNGGRGGARGGRGVAAPPEGVGVGAGDGQTGTGRAGRGTQAGSGGPAAAAPGVAAADGSAGRSGAAAEGTSGTGRRGGGGVYGQRGQRSGSAPQTEQP